MKKTCIFYITSPILDIVKYFLPDLIFFAGKNAPIYIKVDLLLIPFMVFLY